MVQLCVILVFLAFHLHDYGVRIGEPLAGGVLHVAIWTVAPLVFLGLVHELACRRAGRRMDRRGDLSAFAAGTTVVRITRGVATLHTLFAVLSLGWLGTLRDTVGDLIILDECLAITPLLLFFAWGWWSTYPLEMRLREAVLFRDLHEGTPIHRPPGRLQHVWLSFRHGVLIALLPIALISAWHELVIYAAAMHWIPAPWLRDESTAASTIAGLKLAGTLVAFILTPFLLRRVWDTVPIESGPFREMLESMCRRHRVRLRTPLLWRTHGSIVNGAVLGLVWPFRYMLFTDALLERLSARQVEAVAAHEVGHVRRHHIFWTILAVLAALLLAEFAADAAQTMFDERYGAAFALVSTLAVFAVVLGIFGFVSRRFEWQADAFAVQDLSASSPAESQHAGAGDVVTPEAVVAMASALRAVASINGIDIQRFAFRHGSIESRIIRLGALVGLPRERLPIDRSVATIKIVSAIALAAAVTLLALRWAAARGAHA